MLEILNILNKYICIYTSISLLKTQQRHAKRERNLQFIMATKFEVVENPKFTIDVI